MKDFVSKWGMSFKEIMAMPRLKFCDIHGNRFMDMNYCQFKKTIKRESPEIKIVNNDKLLWQKDRLVNKVESNALKFGLGFDKGDENI